jgi:hypothetical protein
VSAICIAKFTDNYQKEKVSEYVHTPIIGYNSGKYDITFVIGAIDGDSTLALSDKTIRNGSGYMKVQLGRYQFLDAMNFASTGNQTARLCPDLPLIQSRQVAETVRASGSVHRVL